METIEIPVVRRNLLSLIRNDGYVLRFRGGGFYTSDGLRRVTNAQVKQLNEALELRRVKACSEKYFSEERGDAAEDF